MSIYVNNKMLDTFNFSGGECHVKIDVSTIGASTKILVHLNSSDDTMCLLLAVDAVRRINPSTAIELTIPYFPYARQDRVCNVGESLSVKVMADIINHLNCSKVTIYDPHSDVTPALLHNCSVISLADIIMQSTLAKMIHEKSFALVSPDAGAEKKIREVGKRLSSTFKTVEVFCATKVRETSTGNIIATELQGDVQGKNLILIDDICDGGRTFIELAKLLKSRDAKNICLYVTHGIFSKGLDVLKEHFSQVFCYHTMLKPADIDTKFLHILGAN